MSCPIQELTSETAFVPSTAALLESKPQPEPTSDPPQPSWRTNIWSRTVNGSDADNTSTLGSFESVMQAMDIELDRSSGKQKPPARKDKGKEKATEPPVPVEGDIEAAMDAELKTLLEREGLGADTDDDEEDVGPGIDYNLIKNFLESFKSQGGLSGPVSNLTGRLQPDLKLPRDFS